MRLAAAAASTITITNTTRTRASRCLERRRGEWGGASVILVTMVDDPPMEPAAAGRGKSDAAPLERRRRGVAAGQRGDLDGVEAGRGDPDPSVRVAWLGARARMGALSVADIEEAFADPDPAVRRRG